MSMNNSNIKNRFNFSYSAHMNLKQNHYTNFKCISYDITFDVDPIGTLNLLAPRKE